MVFAEIAILRCFQKEGWDGRWIDNFGGKTKDRLGYWGDASEIIKDLPAEQKALLERIRKKADCKGGCFDVFCWRDGDVVFAES
jgi:hypothetical protein